MDLNYLYDELKSYEYEINEKEKKVNIVNWEKEIKF